MTFKQFLGILRARRRMIAAIACIVVIALGAVSLSLTPRYTAAAQLLIDVKTPDPVAGQVLPAHLLNSYIATQVELIASEKVALRVVDALALDTRPEWRTRLADVPMALQSNDGFRRAIAQALVKDLKVRPAKDSNLLIVSYASTDREAVADVANAFVGQYIETSVDMRVQPARQIRQFFGEQARQAREELQRAQDRLSEFRRSKGLATTDERDDVANLRLQELAQQLTTLQGARVEAERRRESALGSRNGARDAPEVLGSTLIQTLKSQLASAEARLSERATVLGSSHPEILRLREEVASLSRRIATETTHITGSLERTYQISAARESEIRDALERQQAIVLANKGHREQISMLQRDVDAAQRAFDAVSARVNQTSLESQITQANVAPIASAVTPLRPSSPNTPLTVAVGAAFGLLLGVVSALLAESVHGKVREAADLERITGMPVVGELGPAPRRRLDPRRSDAFPRLDGALPRAAVSVTPIAAAESPLPGRLMDVGLLARAEVRTVAVIAGHQGACVGEAVQPEVIAAFDVDHPFLDELRMLRTRIKARLRDSGGVGAPVVAVVSEGGGEGKSFSAANLAVSFAQGGDRTLLIDADLRGGRQHELFSLSNHLGLSSVLSLHCNPDDALQPVPGLGGLTVMTAGPDVVSPTDLLACGVTEPLLQRLSQAFDMVIVDTPAAGIRPDASLIVAAAKHYVIVARRHHTLSAAVETLTRSLGQFGARMIGAVLVKV